MMITHYALHYKNRILQSFLILALGLFCYAFARNITTINDDITPLSSGNVEAMFYIENTETHSMTCIGDGIINTTQEIVCNEATAKNAIISEPDYSNYLSKDLTVVWDTIQNSPTGYQVIGEVYSNESKKSKRSVTDYGAVGDGITDDSNAIIKCIAENDIIVFPTGTYYVTKQLIVPNEKTLIGTGDAIIDFHGNTTSGYDYGYIVNENSSWMPSNTLAHDIKISNLTIKKSNLTEEAKSIILFTNITGVTMENVTVDTTLDDCANTVNMLINCHNINMTGCKFYNNQYTRHGGFWVQDRSYKGISYGTSNITFSKCEFVRNSGIDELIAVYAPAASTGERGHVSNVVFNDCKIVRNNCDTAGTRAPYLIMTSVGNSDNIKFNNCNITDNSLYIGLWKLLVDGNQAIYPINISGCSVTGLQSYNKIGSYLFITEGETKGNTVAQISDSELFAGNKIVCCDNDINLDRCKFYLSNNAVALDSNNVANNCTFYFNDCTSSGRMIRNNKAIVNDSTITVLSGSASKYVIQPKEINNLTIESDVPVIIQK